MSERAIDLVTNGTCHLGFNLVRHLRAHGRTVRAGVGTPTKDSWVRPLGCEIARIDVLDKTSLVTAMQGVDVVYSVGIAFKSESKNPEEEIVRPNVEGPRNVVEAAAAAGVRKVVHVSSMASVDPRVQPFRADTWNPDNVRPFEHAETQGEKLALEVARANRVDISVILPSAMIGPDFLEFTEVLAWFPMLLSGNTIDVDLHIMVVDVRDVVAACHAASTNGWNGGRYIVTAEPPVSTGRMMEIAREMFPELGLKPPALRLSRAVALPLAHITGALARLFGWRPPIPVDTVREYSGASHLRADMRDTARDLGLPVIGAEQTVRDTLRYTKDHADRIAPLH